MEALTLKARDEQKTERTMPDPDKKRELLGLVDHHGLCSERAV